MGGFFSCREPELKAYSMNMDDSGTLKKGYTRVELILLLCIAVVVFFLAIPIYNSWSSERQPIPTTVTEPENLNEWNTGKDENGTESEPLILPTE